MKHIFTLILLTSFLSYKAQSAFEKNSHVLTIGYGLPNLYKGILQHQLEIEDADIKARLKQQGSSFTYSNTGIGPLFFKYDYAVTRRIGLGLSVGYHSISVTETYGYTRNYYSSPNLANQRRSFYQAITRSSKSFSLGARFNYHFGEKSRLDPYVGLAVGYNNAVLTESYATNDPDILPQDDVKGYLPIPVYLAATMGLRAYITENLGFYVEIGLDKWSLIQGGLALKVL